MTPDELVEFVTEYRAEHPCCDKAQIQDAVANHFALNCSRSVFHDDSMAVRFSTAKDTGFSNTVLSLSALRAYDHRPFVVCLVRPDRVEYFLANSTFLKKISHSSHQLRIDNIKGSFNGSDILREYEGIPNGPVDFDRLFAIHQEFSWEENVGRLVEETNAIAGTGRKFAPTDAQRQSIMFGPQAALQATRLPAYSALQQELQCLVQEKADAILKAAQVNNVNLRGNAIEQIITGAANAHGLADMHRPLGPGLTAFVEVKTKLLDRASAPKAYNVDKSLQTLAVPGAVVLFCFVGVDLRNATVQVRTLSVFDSSVLAATCVQFHWAGRNSRGVTQLTGDLNRLFNAGFRECIDVRQADTFLERLLAL